MIKDGCFRLTKLKVEHNLMNGVEDSEKVSGISLSINGLDVTKNKFTRHLLDSYITTLCHVILATVILTTIKSTIPWR